MENVMLSVLKPIFQYPKNGQFLYNLYNSMPNKIFLLFPDDFNSLSNFSLPDQISASVKCTLACMLAHTKLVDSQTGRFISASRIFIVKLLIKTLHSSIKDFYPEFKVVNSGGFFDTFFNLVDICKNIDIERGGLWTFNVLSTMSNINQKKECFVTDRSIFDSKLTLVLKGVFTHGKYTFISVLKKGAHTSGHDSSHQKKKRRSN
ncbi:uncharacterized protein LOC111048071 isoform X1 [Nilaparvata lugens]|uniref:uncharacterized protein LOC111048071 isoform X1 n=1 Tax=Nilaparvata lugens TaxID=108931 RepID=UPI00193CF8CC|nr:uncharacterized protein LOC111048071 isoform X1 [Nilaparvata lugens]